MKFVLILVFIYEYFSWYYQPINQMYFEPWKFKFEEIETEKEVISEKYNLSKDDDSVHL